jgi:hypothetical protein
VVAGEPHGSEVVPGRVTLLWLVSFFGPGILGQRDTVPVVCPPARLLMAVVFGRTEQKRFQERTETLGLEGG